MAEIVRITRTAAKVFRGASVSTYAAIGKGIGGQSVEAEVFSVPGVHGRPHNGQIGVFLPIGGGRRYGAIASVVNYAAANEVLLPGETLIFSCAADGSVLKSKIYLDTSGNIALNGNTKRLVTYAELNTALQLLVTAINGALATKANGSGSAGTLTLDISAAQTTTVRTGG